MLIYLPLGGSSGSFQDPGSCLDDFIFFSVALLDHLYLRIAIMAQAILPCHFLLMGRIEVIRHL